MEDGHICNHAFDEDSSVFAVFDGHGGPDVSKFAEENYCRILNDTKMPQVDSDDNTMISEWLRQSFFNVD